MKYHDHFMPNKPGVYLIKDRSGKIIYIGKAISIAKRIKSHLSKSSKIAPHIADIDYIVTANELEALILEAVLIKKHHPKYNILLRDDKQYPYIKLTLNEEWPRILMVRKIENDGAKYFGPYMSQTVRDVFKMVKRLFQIRWCKEFKKRNQPCFYYHMGKCLAPCVNDISKEKYMRSIEDIKLFLEGKYETAIDKLKDEMKEASKNKEYEIAAQIRDKIRLFEKIFEEQKIVTTDKRDVDVFSVSTFGNSALVLILEIRAGKLTGKENYFIKDIKYKMEDILRATLIQYYSSATFIPVIIVAAAGKDNKILEAALTKLKKSKVKIILPKTGKYKDLFKMAEENSKIVLQQRLRSEKKIYNSLFDLKNSLQLKKIPYRIEAFDISTTMGIETVGSMVVFEGGIPHRSDYRKFKVAPGRKAHDDVAGIRNVVMRRYAGSLSHQLSNPDLILIDGGKGQINAAKPFIPKGSSVLGLTKKLEEVYLPGKKEAIRLKVNSPALKLLCAIRDEAHRFAITFHRKRRSARMLLNQ
jgi:excinuclease ABC subunit C